MRGLATMAAQRFLEAERLADELYAEQRLIHSIVVMGISERYQSIQILREDHAVLPLPVIAHRERHPVDLVVGVKKREAKATMEGNRVAIDRSGHAVGRAAAMRGSRGKEMPIEEAPQPLSTTCGMHAEEVDVGLVGKGLRNETDEEPNDLTIINGREAGRAEVDEEELGKHGSHRPTTPPCINNRDDRLIVGLLQISDDNLGYCLLLSRQHA